MAEPVPFDLQIMKKLQELIGRINTGNVDPSYELCGEPPQNYPYDVQVFIGRTVIGVKEVPSVTLLEAAVPFAGIGAAENSRKQRFAWNLLVQGFAEDDKTNPGVPAYQLKARVLKLLNRVIDEEDGKPLFPEDYMLGKLIVGLTIGQGVVRPPEAQVSPNAFFYIPLVVQLATDTRNPYAKA